MQLETEFRHELDRREAEKYELVTALGLLVIGTVVLLWSWKK